MNPTNGKVTGLENTPTHLPASTDAQTEPPDIF